MIGGRRMLVKLVSNDVRNVWNEQGLRGSILASFSLQIILLVLGNHRKSNPRTLIRTTLWCVYYLAYAVVPPALTIIAQSTFGVSPNELYCLWAQFLLLDLGGPDNFTAYSLEDNELWSRHLMFIVIQSGLALYILLSSFPGHSCLPLLSVLVYAAALIKCFGRLHALRSGSKNHRRGSMLGQPDPGPDYVKFLEDFILKKSQGFMVKAGVLEEPHLPVTIADAETRNKEILEAYRLLKIFNPLFVDLILTYEDRKISTTYFDKLDSSQAFRAVEIELGFAYDKLFTKANVVYNAKGLILQATSGFLILVVLLGFCFLIDKGKYHVLDGFITYLVMSADVAKEMFALITMVCSDWFELWLNRHNHIMVKKPSKQRWSNSIAQLDLLSVALEKKAAARMLRIQKLFGIDEYLEKQRYETRIEVSDNLKDMIYTRFKEFMNRRNSDKEPLSIPRGGYALEQNKCIALLWSVNDVAFDQSFLIWHIATSLCYYSQVDDQVGKNRTESNHISKYMLSLLVSNPEMLPNGIGMIRYRDTCADAKRFFKKKGPCNSIVEACIRLRKVECKEVSPSEVTGDRSKTILFDGCRLAKDLIAMDSESMWKVISQVWIEILGYVAANCGGIHHSEQLGRGGQLLTHVWLLMAQLGLTEHFQVSQGHARAKLIVS